MNFIISADTDIGTTKSTNQDSLALKIINTSRGRMAFGILCDGMGGLDKGEVASAAVINAFDHWIKEDLPSLCNSELQDNVIKSEWEQIVTTQNEKLHKYGAQYGTAMGTTLVAILITETRYYLMNVGDSRAYLLNNQSIQQLTEDQTFIAREIKLGNMTYEQAQLDPRKNVLLQCIGASDAVYPDMFFGTPNTNDMFLLCSDGFRHEVKENEIFEQLNPATVYDAFSMQQNARILIDRNKERQERDNISVAMIRTF